jgi:nitroreductase
MNDVMRAIKERRSIREFEDREIEKEKVEQIIEAGIWAPSARNMQPWKFILVKDKKLIKEMDRAVKEKVIDNPRYYFVKERAKTREDVIFYSAPLVVFILGEKENHWSTIDCSLAAENMMLAAYSLGIGSCMIGMARHLKGEKILERLKFPPGYDFVLAVAFGYPKERPAPKERKRNITSWIG